MAPRTIRASEIATFEFCHRAWAYQVQGEANSELVRLTAGTRYHHRLNRRLRLSRQLLRVGKLAVLAAMAWAALALAGSILGGG